MLRLQCQQNTPEWLSIRKKKVCASDAPIIMNCSPWRTPYQLWEEKLNLAPAQEENAAMRRGKETEEEALKKYNEITGNNCSPGVFLHVKNYWMLASFDGVSPDESIAVEIKCPGEEDHVLAKEGKIPNKYLPQLQHQLAILGKNMLHYFSYRNGDFCLLEVYRDEGYIDKLIQEEEKFFDCMQNFDPPPLTDKDYAERKDVSWLCFASRWQDLNRKKKILEKEEEEIRSALQELSAGVNCRGGGIKLSHTKRKGQIDYKSIPQICGLDLDCYRKKETVVTKIVLDGG